MVSVTLLTLHPVIGVGWFLTLLTLLPIIGVRARDTSFNGESVRRVSTTSLDRENTP